MSDVIVVPIGNDGKGLAVCFTKRALLRIKEGNTYPVDVMTSAGKVKMMFMRDRTFNQHLKKFQTKVATVQVEKATDESLADTASLAAEIGESLPEAPSQV